MNIPNNLEECFKILKNDNCNKELCEFAATKEDLAVSLIHFTTGMQIRNNWKFWKGKNKLVKYFNKIGIYHPDDMSGMILTSFWRHLNNQPLELEKQAKHYLDYWDLIKW